MNQPQLGSYQHIALGDIYPSKTNPRKTFDPDALVELANSIREHGVAVPILVRPTITDSGKLEGDYEIVTGERRYHAAHMEGLTEIPAIVAELDDEEAAQIQMVENLQRADLHPLEEAEGYGALYLRGLTIEDVAKKTGKTAAHVGRMMKLEHLSLSARRLFLAAHITLGHALLLARLTIEDQDRAVREMVHGSGDYAKMALMAVIDQRERNIAQNSYAQHHRVVDMTEGGLREWITQNVLLQLAKAPWSLADPLLVPEAGPCTTCPKRTGSNPALFADLTADADVCLDAVCFQTKQKAFVAITTKAAEQAGKTVVKLSAKSGHQPLDKPLTPKTKLQHGQWVAAEPASCKAVTQGVLVDEPGRYSEVKATPGELLTVCADQKCKVHKHTVDRPSPKRVSGSSLQASADTAKSAAERKAEADALLEREKAVRQEIVDTMLEALNEGSGVLRLAVIRMMENVESGIAWAADQLGLKVRSGMAWHALTEHIKIVHQADLQKIAFMILAGEGVAINGWHDAPNAKDSRKVLWELARQMDVDADAIAADVERRLVKALEPEPVPVVPPAKPVKAKLTKTAQATRKQAAAKKFSAKKTLSPESRKRIQDATVLRWAVRKKTKTSTDRKSAAAGERANDA